MLVLMVGHWPVLQFMLVKSGLEEFGGITDTILVTRRLSFGVLV
uniref:Uncharacterized protein n=1 Tax=Chenopodium quinoa TaxID=63459 RepID=A0A803NB05_CHEQI